MGLNMKVKQCVFDIKGGRFALTVRLNDGLPKTISISGQKPFRFNGVIAKSDRADIIGVLKSFNEIQVFADDKTYNITFNEECTKILIDDVSLVIDNSDAVTYPFKELE